MNELYKEILNELPSGVWVTDSEDRVTYINKAMTVIAGASAEKFTGLYVFKDLDKPGNKEFLESYRKVKKNLFPGEYEVRLKDSEGKGFVHRGWMTPIVKNKTFNGMIVTAEDITEKDIFEEALKDSEEKFRRTIEFAADGILLGSNEGFIIEANQAACELFGMSKREMLNLHISKMPFTKESLERSPMRFDLLKEGKTVISERSIHRKDGKEIIIEMKTKMMDDCSYQSIYRDITERKRIERELKENEEKYSRLIHNINDGIGIVDKNENFIFANESAERIFEVGKGGLENRSLWDFISEGNKNKILSETTKRQSGQSTRYELEIITAKGTNKIIQVAASPDYDEKGNVTGSYGVFFDVTDRKKSENLLKENEEKYRTLFEESNDAIYLMEGDTFVECNYQAVKMFSCDSRDDMVNHKPMEFSPPVQPDGRSTNDSALEHISAALAGNSQRFYWKHRKKDGLLFDAEVSLNRLVLNEKIYLQAIVRDVTFRMKAEKELYKLSSIVKQSFEGIAVADMDGNLMYVNSAWTKMHGFDNEEELLGKSLEISHNSEQLVNDVIPFNEKVMKYGFNTGEVGHVRNDGTPFPTLMNTTLLKDDNGKSYAFAGFAIDISEHKKAEEELKKHRNHLEELVYERTSQLESVNKELESFSYSVSHDLRAPVRHISGFTDILKRSLGTNPDQASSSALEKIRKSADKMERLIDDLLEFSKTGRLELSKNKTDMVSIIETVKKDLCDSLPDRKIEWKLSKLPQICCDRNLMRIVWENLISNACKYTAGKDAVIEVGVQEKECVYEFFIKDNGVGFDTEYSAKLFGVFQRLHQEKDFPGTGIGLATVKRIISRHGGAVRAESNGVGKGASFYFTLPKQGGSLDGQH